MEIAVERWSPYLGAVIGTALWAWALGMPFPAPIDTLMAAAGTVSAVVVGFLASAMAIVLGLTGSPVFQQLKSAGYHAHLFGYLRSGVFGGILFLLLSLAGFFLPIGAKPGEFSDPITWFFIIWILVGIMSLFLYVRVTLILFKLLEKA
ncbi:MAG: hypothetical protein ACE363_06005 [Alphaproteobacteria bacterium]